MAGGRGILGQSWKWCLPHLISTTQGIWWATALRRPQKSFWLLCILIFHQPLFASLLIYSSNFNGSIIFIIKCPGLAFSLMPCWAIQESFSICTELRYTHFSLISVSNLSYPAVPLLSLYFWYYISVLFVILFQRKKILVDSITHFLKYSTWHHLL